MTLEEKINDELKKATLERNQLRMDTLRAIRASIIEFNKSGANKEMTKSDEDKILLNAAKKRKDAIEIYQKAGRNDLASKEIDELKIIEEFLPKQMDENEIKVKINEIIINEGFSGMKDMGKAMKSVMTEFQGKADGSIIQKIVREILSGNN